MVGCVLSQLKTSGFSILSCEKCLCLRSRTFFTDKNGELLVFYPILKVGPLINGGCKNVSCLPTTEYVIPSTWRLYHPHFLRSVVLWYKCI